jgi:hypothetical protein
MLPIAETFLKISKNFKTLKNKIQLKEKTKEKQSVETRYKENLY